MKIAHMKKTIGQFALPFLLLTFSSTVVKAEDEVFALKPLHVIEDVNGVDLLSGTYRPKIPPLAIPAAAHLMLENLQKFQPRMDGKFYDTTGGISQKHEAYTLNYGGSTAESFNCLDGDCTSSKLNGSTFRAGTISKRFFYRQGSTGLTITFGLQSYWQNIDDPYNLYNYNAVFSFYPTSMSYPNGEAWTFAYDSQPANDGLDHTYYRPNTITSNLGYVMKLTYLSNDLASGLWGSLETAAIYKSDDLVNPVAKRSYSSTGVVTDELGRKWNNGGFGSTLGADETSRFYSLREPGATVNSIDVASEERQYAGVTHGRWVTSVKRDGLTWNYNYVASSAVPFEKFTQLNITGPAGYSRVLQLDLSSAPNFTPHIKSDTDSLGNVTWYEYDGQQRVKKITYPEGNVQQIDYDDNGNTTSLRSIAKPGSGLPDIVETAFYPLNCSAIDCFRPRWSRDGKGQQTDYSYDSTHGGLLTKTEPAGANGLRRKTINEYENVNGLYRLNKTRVCSVYASGSDKDCGTESELVTRYSYWRNTYLPLTVTKTNGIGSLSAVTTYDYDNAGHVLSIDGPLAGTNDAVYYRYDAAGRRIWEIGALNDAGKRVATRTSYRDADDQVLKIETGTLITPTDTNLVIAKTQANVFDGYGKKTRASFVDATGVTQTLEQYSYDTGNRLLCSTRRMNPALFASLPASACTLGSSGSFGPDRIVKNEYDTQSRLKKTTSGYGTVDAGIDITMSYWPNGQVASRGDGNGKLTQYSYDGFDRLDRTTYPDGSYEQNTYDKNNNLQTFRKRDGVTLTHSYDAMNLRTQTLIPNEATLGFTYDGLGRADVTSQGNSSIDLTYDALGRVGSVIQGGRTLGYLYDLAGRRVRLTYPDGFYLTFNRDDTGAVTDILENGTTALVSYGFDDLGRATSLTRGNGRSSSIGYDTTWRLQTLSHAGVNTTTLDYNPANQIISQIVSNDAFTPRLPTAGAVSYVSNALNQYNSVGGNDYSYDNNGNLTAGGGWTYGYNAHNRLVSAVGGGSTLALSYDPKGRLSQSTINGSTTTLLYDGDELIAEYNNTGTLLRRYVHGAGSDDPLLQYEGSGFSDKRYLLADERGSIIAETNASGTLTATHTYGAYGEPSSTVGTRFRYTGQIFLPGTYLYYYKARVYNPIIGKFLQTDPIGYKDGMNWYAYVGDDPVNRADPSGESGELFWSAPDKVTVTFNYVMSGVSPQFTPAQLNAQIASAFSGTVNVNGVNVTVTAQAVQVTSPTQGQQTNNINVVQDTAGVTSSGRSQTDSIGGRQITLGATGTEAATSITGAHEAGHSLGAGDQYKDGLGANGATLQSDVAGPQNIMKDLSGAGANAQTLGEIVNASTNTNSCAKGVSAASKGC